MKNVYQRITVVGGVKCRLKFGAPLMSRLTN